MTNFKTRDELRNLVIDSFSKEAEIFSIFFFGKEVDKKEDEYSDLDMIVCSSDLARTQSKYLQILNSISPVIGTYLLGSTENNIAQMIMFRDFSPYQKIDLSITSDISHKEISGFSPFLCAYEGEKSSKPVSRLRVIEPNTVINQLNDFLFSVPRFTKCLFRRDFDMYRRWKGISDIVMVLLHEKYFDWEEKTSRRKISAKETSELHKRLNKSENESLNQIFNLDGKLNIIDSYKASMSLLIELCQTKAERFQVELDTGFIDHIQRFLNSETSRYDKL